MEIVAAVVREDGGTLSIETLDLAEPRESEILVRLVATGVCHTDLKARALSRYAPKPVVLGHEGAGIIERVGGAVRAVVPGDHVVMTYDSCAICPSCVENEPAYCYQSRARNFGCTRPDGSTTLSGNGVPVHGSFFGQSSFATFALGTERNVVKVRKDAPLELLGPLGCGIQTGAGAIINTLSVSSGRSVAIFGVGSVGLSAVMAARLVNASRIIALDVLDHRLDRALELGATDTVNTLSEPADEAIERIAPHGVDVALDTTAVAPLMRQAIQSLAPRGTFGFVAVPPEQEFPVDLSHLLRGGRRVRGVIQGDSKPHVFIPALVDFYMQGRLPIDKIVTYYPFDRIDDAFGDSRAGTAIKPVLRF
mgnify:CR=1 FL=1